MANSFSREEQVAFMDVLAGFQDYLIMSRNVSVYKTDQTIMERTGNTIWRPMPYIATSIDAPPRTDISALYKNMTQLSVPSTIGFYKTVPYTLDANELRDQLQEGRLGDSAKQRLASDINVALMNVAANQGAQVVKRNGAATGFDDVAQCEAVFNEQGIPTEDRYLALNTRDYNGMASNLAGRQTLTGKPLTAYERAYVGPVSSFETYKLDYSTRKAAALGAGIVIDTTNGASNYYNPAATITTINGTNNVDNRYQVVTVSSTAGVAIGDSFTVAGVESVHHITKLGTGQLKTFRVMAINSGTTMTISAPIISNQVPNDAAAQYQNVIVTPNAAAPIVFLNTVTAPVNPFWHKTAIELLPGRYAIPTNAGVAVMRANTDQGLELVMSKFYDINTKVTKYTFDTPFGVVMTNPEMAGIVMFGQT